MENDPDLVGRQEVSKGKCEPGQTGQYGCYQKQCRPAVETFPSKHPKKDDQARADAYQTQQYMYEGEGCGAHSENHFGPFSRNGLRSWQRGEDATRSFSMYLLDLIRPHARNVATDFKPVFPAESLKFEAARLSRTS